MSRGSQKRTNANEKTGPRLVQSGIINFGDFEVKHSVISWLTGKSEVTEIKKCKNRKMEKSLSSSSLEAQISIL